jgi:putative hydrolase of the HAD superfamily
MAAPTHVLFDFFGTLVAYSNSRTEQGYKRSHELLVGGGAKLEYSEFLARWDATCDEFESRAVHSLDEYSMDALCTEFLMRALPRVPSEEAVSLFRATYLEEWNKGVQYIPGVRELVAELSERFVLVLVTNTHHADLVHRHLHAMGVERRFVGVITSVEHGKRKPSPCIFDRALAQSGGRPHTSVYVGDSFAADYRGARNAGLSCLLIDPDRRHDIPDADRIRDIFETRARLVG